MGTHFKKKFNLRASDFDQYDHILPSTILDLMQDTAGNHAETLGIGYKDFYKLGYYWIVIRNRYDVIELPHLFEEVEVDTWYKQKGKIDFDREYEIRSLDGKLLIKGIAKWVVISTNKRMLVPARSVPFPEECDNKANYDGISKINFTEELNKCAQLHTTFCDIDHNGHVNNINYAKYILNVLKLAKDEEIASFEINYEKELLNDEEVKLAYTKVDKTYYIKGFKSNNEVSFVSKIVLK